MIDSSRAPGSSARPRVHMGLRVRDLDASMDFYRTLLGSEPSKLRPGYAKFEPAGLGLNLSIMEGAAGVADPMERHFGIEVGSSEDVHRHRSALERAGLRVDLEEGTTCCHAVQDKVWVRDPDGNRWEVFHVLADAPESSAEAATSAACCGPGAGC